MDRIVDQGRQQIVRRTDRMQITREVHIDPSRGLQATTAAARTTSLDAECRPERRFAQCERDTLRSASQRLGQSYRNRRLALATTCRIDRRDQDQSTLGARVIAQHGRQAEFGHVLAVE